MQERLLFNANNRLNSCRTSQFSIDGIVVEGVAMVKSKFIHHKYHLEKINFLH